MKCSPYQREHQVCLLYPCSSPCFEYILRATNDRPYNFFIFATTPSLRDTSPQGEAFRLPLRGAVGIAVCGVAFRATYDRHYLTLSERKSFTVLLCSLQCCTFVPPQAKSSAVGILIRTHYLLSIFVYSLLCTIDLYAGLIILPQPITSSSLCAHQPTILEIAKSGVYISVGMPSIL